MYSVRTSLAIVWSILLFCAFFSCSESPVTPSKESVVEAIVGQEKQAEEFTEKTHEPPKPESPDPTEKKNPIQDASVPEEPFQEGHLGEPEPGLPERPSFRPISAPARKWTWVDVPESRCGFGKATGFALNPNPGATRLYIYFQGGGGCWKHTGAVGNCFSLVPTAVNLGGFTKTTFQIDPITRQNLASFTMNRRTLSNVLRDAQYVFIPYCTGDVFSGTTSVKYPNGRTMYYYGHKNVQAFLDRILPTFPKVKQVILAGSSAGGYGAAINWWYVQRRFGDKVRVDLLSDSAPTIEPKEGRWQEWQKAWKTILPLGCTDCHKGIGNLLEYYSKTLLAKGHRAGILSFDRDSIIRTFFGISDLTGSLFKKRLTGLLDYLDKKKNVKYFVLEGSSHTMLLLAPTLLVNKKGIPLEKWLRWMVTDDPAWQNYRR